MPSADAESKSSGLSGRSRSSRTRDVPPNVLPRLLQRRFLTPRYWGTWLALALFRVVVALPYSAQMAFGRWLGRLIGRYSGYRRHVVRTNLELCFPHWDDRKRMDIERQTFESFGMGLVEEGLAWWVPDRRLRGLAHVEGWEHLHRALRQGRGVLLLTAHLTSLEICGRLMQSEVKTAYTYRQHENPLLDVIIRRGRNRRSAGGVPNTDARALVRFLRQNRALWIAADQDFGAEHSIFVPFFGIPAATLPVLSRLARLSGAAVVPFQNMRQPDGKGYLLRFEPPLAGFPSDDVAADARRMNEIIERWVAEAPEQYLWTHRRFKTRPAGGLKFYKPKRRATGRRPGEPL